jgi:signal transduction histidine kinase
MIDRPDANARAPCVGDARRILQILVNLVGNALRYSPAGGTMAIDTGWSGGTARITIADRGKGIAAEDQARIFGKFERVDPGEAGGNGLGLFIARRLATAMGGDLTVESAPGEGARFTLTLPARQAAGDQH